MHTLVAVTYLCKSIASARTPPAHPGYKMGSPKVHGIVRTLITMTFDRLFHSINSISCKGSRLRPFFESVRVKNLTWSHLCECMIWPFTNMYPVQLEDRIHWIIATLSLRMPTKPAHYRLLANRTMPPFSPHRNINKGSFRNPPVEREVTRWSFHSEAMLQTAFYDVDWDMFRRVHLTSASSRM